MLNDIAADLGANTSPQTLARCAEFLMQHMQFEKAIDLYVMAKRLPQAIEMCLKSNVTITEEMAEKLTPPLAGSGSGDGSTDASGGGAGRKDARASTTAADERKETLKALGKVCYFFFQKIQFSFFLTLHSHH